MSTISDLLYGLIETRWRPHLKNDPEGFPFHPGDECWEWAGAVQRSGKRPYPVVRFLGQIQSPARLLFALHNDQLSKTIGNLVPSCGNALCINPEHMQGKKFSTSDYRTPIRPTSTSSTPSPDAAEAAEAYKLSVFKKFRELGGSREAIINDGFSTEVVDHYLPLFLEHENS